MINGLQGKDPSAVMHYYESLYYTGKGHAVVLDSVFKVVYWRLNYPLFPKKVPIFLLNCSLWKRQLGLKVKYTK